MSRWFRMYGEVLDDPKVQRLPGDDFKVWVNLLCLASRNDGKLPSLEDIGFSLRLDAKKTKAVVSRLVAAGLLDPDGERFEPHGWSDRQYKSDVSTSRVKQFRKRKEAAARNCDETFHATPPETETETETDITLAKANGAFSSLGSDQPASPQDADKQFWDTTKAYLASAGVKNPGAVVGRWIRDHGKSQTAEALTRAQLERAVEPVAFVQGCFRAVKGGDQPSVPL